MTLRAAGIVLVHARLNHDAQALECLRRALGIGYPPALALSSTACAERLLTEKTAVER